MGRLKGQRYDFDFKVEALRRMMNGENVTELARELGLRRTRIYAWREVVRVGGVEGLRRGGLAWQGEEPALPEKPDDLAVARRRVGELERKIGQQQLELDFFRQALRRVGAARRAKVGPGATASTRSSKR